WTARLVRHGPWGALAERWVPEQLRGARLNPGRRGAALLSVIAALAAVVAAVGVWWSRPQPRPIGPVAAASAAGAPPGPGTGLLASLSAGPAPESPRGVDPAAPPDSAPPGPGAA